LALNVPDEGYSRMCALILISTFLFHQVYVSSKRIEGKITFGSINTKERSPMSDEIEEPWS
jgi:hypothetical protein